MSLLEQVNSPEDIRGFSVKQLETLCGEIRRYMIDCCAKNPGHLGASLGAVELAVALHYVYNTPVDKIVWDVGHQAYAHKIITGRREAFKTNRTYKGISGFPKMSESIFDTFGVGHSSTSVSAALGMAVASKLSGIDEKIVAVIGDGALTGGMAFEGLNNAGSMKTDILVILNDNHISIDEGMGAMHNYLLKISTSETYNRIKNHVWDIIGSARLRRGVQKFMFSTKMAVLKSGSLFESMGFRYFGAIDGNDIGQLTTTLASLRNIKGPKLLHVITKKGKGYKPAEENQTVWHAPGTFDPVTGKRSISAGTSAAKYQDVFGETLLELARADKKIVAVTPAMASGCGMNIMMREIPERTFDVGIAEQHAVTFSAGMAASGLLPFCNIYSSFMQRAYDSVIHDVALQNLKVVFCLDRAGLVGEDGATHHGVFDMAAFRPVPNLIIASPLNELELRNIMYTASLPDIHAPIIIRYPRGTGEGVDWRDKEFVPVPIGKGQLLHNGSGTAVLTIGPVGNIAAEAVRIAEERGFSVLHYDMRFLKPVDTDILKDVCANANRIITVEDASVIGGLHDAVCSYVAEHAPGLPVIGLGVPDRFVEQGTVKQLRHECGFDTEDILNAIIE
ncbi:MAG TPA: 1-deoxy-D-xylulose-5-phosphate synthase [Candidatus Coprenecus stercoravium]|uniref:1-deoxy-D-xylulose-5-phosphate synthase n=1 Tax=Candidatus Coprenecus stercoravium TaxID=2840735 RepID=A0A9D2K9F1_9BACT|nr:1-deoxy-D-xylulose-5-phosphate synthase [Candidatus Coprenecus stercoravium]